MRSGWDKGAKALVASILPPRRGGVSGSVGGFWEGPGGDATEVVEFTRKHTGKVGEACDLIWG
jgi:hypothetical protein